MISIKWRIALVMFAGVLSLSSVSILKNRQLHFMGGMAEEYFGMGVNLYYHGQLSPTLIGARIFRPPGYPFFIAMVLSVWSGFPDKAEGLFTREDLHQTRLNAFRAVGLAQAFLLSLTTVILFLYLADYLGTDLGWFHAKILSICLHWKCTYINVALFRLRRGRVDFAWRIKNSFGRCSFFLPSIF